MAPTLFSDCGTCEMPRATMRLLVLAALPLGTVCLDTASADPPKRINNIASSDRAIASMPLHEYPELNLRVPNDPQFDDWERVVRLREFSYRHTAYSNSVKSDSYRAGTAVVDQVLAGNQKLGRGICVSRAAMGVWFAGELRPYCANSFRWAGYDAWTLNSGFQHARRMAVRLHTSSCWFESDKTRGGAREPNSLLSRPKRNVSYTHADGSTPLDYYEFLRMLSRNRRSSVFVEHSQKFI